MKDSNDIFKPAQDRRILIVEDDLVSKTMLEDVLRAHDYEVRHARDGMEGLQIVKSWVPSLILLDLVMPGMDGFMVCESLRKMDFHTRPSVIVISAKDDKETIAEALMKGADDFIVKPVDDLELLARIRAQLRIREFYKETEEDKRNLETILDITNAITATLDTTEVLDIIVKKVAEVTSALRCSIVLIVKREEGYVLASHENPAAKNLKLDLSKYPEIQEVIKTKSPLAVSDLARDPIMESARDLVKGLKNTSALIVPIVFNDEVLGTLILRTRRKGGGFSQKEIKFCQIVANSSYHAIKNARLFEKVLKEKEHLRELAITDQLTNLYNHNFFYNRLEEEFERAVRYRIPLSLIIMDVDDFKRINDNYGHRVGDTVLKEIASTIKNVVRKTDIVARYGGEEFAIILPYTTLHGAVEEAERIRDRVEKSTYGGLSSERITLSIGVATCPHKDIALSGDLVNMADNALYRAKKDGKNCVRSV